MYKLFSRRPLFSGVLRPWVAAARPLVVAVFLASALAIPPREATANPEEGNVVAGAATIHRPSSSRLDVVQQSDRTIIQWRRFDIGHGEQTRFLQPSRDAIALNRVMGRDPSRILGALTANGRIFLVNPAGVFFGPSARIDVAGLVVSTADIRNDDFLAGRYEFTIPGMPNAGVLNQGTITAADGGLVALVAPWVRNDGVIAARLGKVSLAGADTFTLDFYGDSLIQIALSRELAELIRDSEGRPVRARVAHTGRISADGGVVHLTARDAGHALDAAICMDGIVEARSIRQDATGRVVLDSGSGALAVAGRIDATGITGGTVRLSGHDISLGSGAVIEASGDQGGGIIRIGGTDAVQDGDSVTQNIVVDAAAQIAADALAEGPGGSIVLYSLVDADVLGSFSARGGPAGGDGGTIEISSRSGLSFLGHVDAAAPHGAMGTFLLDPDTFTVDAGNVAAINNAVANTLVQATNTLNVNVPINMVTAGAGLTLQSAQIYLNNGNLHLQNGDLLFQGTTNLAADLNVTTRGGDVTFQGNVVAQGQTMNIDTRVNPPVVNPNDGRLLFTGSVQTVHTMDLRTGLGNVNINGNVRCTDRFTADCGYFTNLGTLRQPDQWADVFARGDIFFGNATFITGLTTSMVMKLIYTGFEMAGTVVGGMLHLNMPSGGFLDLTVDVNGLDFTGNAGNTTGTVNGNIANGATNLPAGVTNNTTNNPVVIPPENGAPHNGAAPHTNGTAQGPVGPPNGQMGTAPQQQYDPSRPDSWDLFQNPWDPFGPPDAFQNVNGVAGELAIGVTGGTGTLDGIAAAGQPIGPLAPDGTGYPEGWEDWMEDLVGSFGGFFGAAPSGTGQAPETQTPASSSTGTTTQSPPASASTGQTPGTQTPASSGTGTTPQTPPESTPPPEAGGTPGVAAVSPPPPLNWNWNAIKNVPKSNTEFWNNADAILENRIDVAKDAYKAAFEASKPARDAQQAKIDQSNAKLNEMNAGLQNLAKNQQDATNNLNNQQAVLQNAQQRADYVGGALSKLLFSSDKYDPEEWKNAVNQLNDQYKGMMAEVNGLKQNVAAAQNDLNGVNQAIANQQQVIANQQQVINQQKGQLNAINSDVVKAQTVLQQTQADMTHKDTLYSSAPSGPSTPTPSSPGSTGTSTSSSSSALTKPPEEPPSTTPKLPNQVETGTYELDEAPISTSIWTGYGNIQSDDIPGFTLKRFQEGGDMASSNLKNNPVVNAFVGATSGAKGWAVVGEPKTTYDPNTQANIYNATMRSEDQGLTVSTRVEYKSGGNYTMTISTNPIDPQDAVNYALAYPNKPNPFIPSTVTLTGKVNPK